MGAPCFLQAIQLRRLPTELCLERVEVDLEAVQDRAPVPGQTRLRNCFLDLFVAGAVAPRGQRVDVNAVAAGDLCAYRDVDQ
jgi:hypothetical protein